VKEKKGERVRGTPPTAGCFGGQQWPAAGNSLGGGTRARVEGCGVQADAEKEVQGLKLGFYKERKGEGAATGVVAINGHWGPAAQGIQGGGVMGKE
jgi:hypothetical protein